VPSLQSNEYYSGYKTYHTQNYLISVDSFGFIIYIHGPLAGRGNDRAAFNSSHYSQNSMDVLSDDEVILVDGGFRGADKVLHQFTNPEMNSAENENILRDMHVFNDEFVLNRASIEHTIHKLKSRTQALATRFPRCRTTQANLFYAGARLHNRIHSIRLDAMCLSLGIIKDGNKELIYGRSNVVSQ
jgi:hypothetical protein